MTARVPGARRLAWTRRITLTAMVGGVAGLLSLGSGLREESDFATSLIGEAASSERMRFVSLRAAGEDAAMRPWHVRAVWATRVGDAEGWGVMALEQPEADFFFGTGSAERMAHVAAPRARIDGAMATFPEGLALTSEGVTAQLARARVDLRAGVLYGDAGARLAMGKTTIEAERLTLSRSGATRLEGSVRARFLPSEVAQ